MNKEKKKDIGNLPQFVFYPFLLFYDEDLSESVKKTKSESIKHDRIPTISQ
jgi:hypothetical protein